MELFVHTINDNNKDFFKLFSYFKDVVPNQDVILNFQNCTFLRQNAVAALGGFVRYCQQRHCNVFIKQETLHAKVRANLIYNNFLPYFFPNLFVQTNSKNAVPFRIDYGITPAIFSYLKDDFLGKGWIDLSAELKIQIVNYLIEIYTNGFEHALANTGLITCGQFYPSLKQIKLTVVDLGIGIPTSINNFLIASGQSPKTEAEALLWAFEKGNTTRVSGEPGGLGLDLLKTLVKLNKGKLEVYSNSAYYGFEDMKMNAINTGHFFPGTILNITLISDTNQYYLISEKL